MVRQKQILLFVMSVVLLFGCTLEPEPPSAEELAENGAREIIGTVRNMLNLYKNFNDRSVNGIALCVEHMTTANEGMDFLFTHFGATETANEFVTQALNSSVKHRLGVCKREYARLTNSGYSSNSNESEINW
jgi:hypothetical protein